MCEESCINRGNGESLFGYDLFKTFGFHIKQINLVSEKGKNYFKELREKYRDIFKPSLGTVKNFKASVHLKTDTHLIS